MPLIPPHHPLQRPLEFAFHASQLGSCSSDNADNSSTPDREAGGQEEPSLFANFTSKGFTHITDEDFRITESPRLDGDTSINMSTPEANTSEGYSMRSWI